MNYIRLVTASEQWCLSVWSWYVLSVYPAGFLWVLWFSFHSPKTSTDQRLGQLSSLNWLWCEWLPRDGFVQGVHCLALRVSQGWISPLENDWLNICGSCGGALIIALVSQVSIQQTFGKVCCLTVPKTTFLHAFHISRIRIRFISSQCPLLLVPHFPSCTKTVKTHLWYHVLTPALFSPLSRLTLS